MKSTSIDFSRRVTEDFKAHGCKSRVTNFVTIPHALGILTTNMTYFIVLFDYADEASSKCTCSTELYAFLDKVQLSKTGQTGSPHGFTFPSAVITALFLLHVTVPHDQDKDCSPLEETGAQLEAFRRLGHSPHGMFAVNKRTPEASKQASKGNQQQCQGIS